MNTIYDLLRSDEGLNTHPYKDTRGHLTIGVGRCLDCEGISPAEAAVLLKNDVQDRQIELGKTTWWPKLDAVRQAAFVDMAFQLGTGGVLKFKAAIAELSLLLGGPPVEPSPMPIATWDRVASFLLDSDWATETPHRAHRVTEMIRTGLWPMAAG